VTITKYLCISQEQANAARAAQPSPKEIEDAARRFALLGDPTRVRIALVLREIGELCVGDTAKVLDLKISLVSHHVRAFATHNLAEKRRDGKLVRYRLTDAALELLDHAFQPQAATAS
jgi:DNA-binding transcriptional ArsR family regulator